MRWRGWRPSRAGQRLDAALASLDLKALTGSQVVDVLKARYRQNNHDRAQLFAVIAEVMHRGQAESNALEEYPGEFASDEVRAALVLTRRAADSLCDLAEGVVREQPTVYQAFAELGDRPAPGAGIPRLDLRPVRPAHRGHHRCAAAPGGAVDHRPTDARDQAVRDRVGPHLGAAAL